MNTRLLIVSGFLLLGSLLLNLLLSIAIAAWMQTSKSPIVELNRSESEALLAEIRDIDGPWDDVWACKRLGFGYREFRMLVAGVADNDRQADVTNIELVRIEAGWPFASLHYTKLMFEDNPMAWVRLERSRMLQPQAPSDDVEGYVFPRSPILGGFFGNAALYFLAFWGALVAPWLLRYKIRERSGLCPRCAYPIGTSERCTECGALIPAAAKKCAPSTAVR